MAYQAVVDTFDAEINSSVPVILHKRFATYAEAESLASTTAQELVQIICRERAMDWIEIFWRVIEVSSADVIDISTRRRI